MTFKINDQHWNVIISFMENHPEFARGQFMGPSGKSTQRKLWEDLAQQLNGLGFGCKSIEKWQKTWSDIKYIVKKKSAANKKDMNQTGGGPPIQQKLNEFEKRVIGILGKSFSGMGNLECGLQFEMVHSPPIVSVSLPTTTVSAAAETPRVLNLQDQKRSLGVNAEHDHSYIGGQKKQRKSSVETIENNLYKETIDELRLIRNNLSEISATLKDISNVLKENHHKAP